MTSRPAFLELNHTNGTTIVEKFLSLPEGERKEVDRWLLVSDAFGSMTWQEERLLEWINENLI